MYENDFQIILNALKCDFSLRKSPIYVGSGLGGNISQYFFLLSKEVNCFLLEEDNCKITFIDNKLNFHFPKIWLEGKNFLHKRYKTSNLETYQSGVDYNNELILKNEILISLRNELSKLTDKLSILPVTIEQINNLSWLNDQNLQTKDGKLFIQCVNETLNLSSLLKQFDKLNDQIRLSFSKVNNFEPFIYCLPIRTIIGIENIIKFNLDEEPNVFKNNYLFR